MKQDDAQDQHTAYHEAGHAVIGCLLERPLLWATIIPDGCGAVGKARFDDDCPQSFKSIFNQSPEKRHYVEVRAVTEIAGSLAQSIKFPGRARDGADDLDEHWVKELVKELHCETETETARARKACLENARAKASMLLKEHWSWVDAVAQALIKRRKLTSDEVLELRP